MSLKVQHCVEVKKKFKIKMKKNLKLKLLQIAKKKFRSKIERINKMQSLSLLHSKQLFWQKKPFNHSRATSKYLVDTALKIAFVLKELFFDPQVKIFSWSISFCQVTNFLTPDVGHSNTYYQFLNWQIGTVEWFTLLSIRSVGRCDTRCHWRVEGESFVYHLSQTLTIPDHCRD